MHHVSSFSLNNIYIVLYLYLTCQNAQVLQSTMKEFGVPYQERTIYTLLRGLHRHITTRRVEQCVQEMQDLG